ncbi:MAG: hypothetical protein ACE15D_07820 [Candidatus Eisenbacteria bacterium]
MAKGRFELAMLLAAVVAMLLGLEGVTRLGFDRVDRGQKKLTRQWEDAVRAAPEGSCILIVVGNSLLDAALDREWARLSLAAEFDVRVVTVPDTRFFDWYFGIQKLIADGARPSVVALMIGEEALVQKGTRKEYSAQYLFRGSDIISVARQTALGRNEAADLLLGEVSKFWGARAEIRKSVLGKPLPEVGRLLQRLATRRAGVRTPDSLCAESTERLELLRKLGETCGFQAWYVVAPRVGRAEDIEAIRMAGEQAKIPVIVPLETRDVSAEDFTDGYHLRRERGLLFTRAFVETVLALTAHAKRSDVRPAGLSEQARRRTP